MIKKLIFNSYLLSFKLSISIFKATLLDKINKLSQNTELVFKKIIKLNKFKQIR